MTHSPPYLIIAIYIIDIIRYISNIIFACGTGLIEQQEKYEKKIPYIYIL